MALPPVDSLASLSADAWRALGQRLRGIGLRAQLLRDLSAKTRPVAEHLRAPVVKWSLRRMQGLAPLAARMFVHWDPVTPDEARAVLGDGLELDDWLGAGLLRSTAEGAIVSPFLVRTVSFQRDATEVLYVLCDDLLAGGDAVMGLSDATMQLADVAAPRKRAALALDLGCGAGGLAMVLASLSDRVVATDLNPRALAIARANLLLNGIDNVELREGDLFAPVRGEAFDVIVSQPPFVPHPDGVGAATFLFGGPRGDELPLRVLHEVGPHIARGGAASFMIEWPMAEGDSPLEGRLRAAVGSSPDLSLIVVPTGTSDLNVHCASYGKIHRGGDGADAERLTMLHLEHLERLRIRSLLATFTIVRRESRPEHRQTATVTPQELGNRLPTREVVDAILATRKNGGSASAEPQAEAPGPANALPLHSALPIAENLALAGHLDQAIGVYRSVHRRVPTDRQALLGLARLEIVQEKMDGLREKLMPMADMGDHEARRLLGDIHWNRRELGPALDAYAVRPRAASSRPSVYTPCAAPNDARVVRRAGAKRPFLVWVTCESFDRSVVGRWFRPGVPRLWDLAVNCFGADDEPPLRQSQHVVLGGPSKLSAVKAVYRADGEFFDGYRAVLFLDDDIEMDQEDVDRFFWWISRHDLALAHPSLSTDSIGCSRAMFQQREAVIRFTNCVDIRAPAFSAAALATCIDSFDQSLSGGGLPHVWAHLLRDRRHAIGVVDAVVARHMRPVDPLEGRFYRHLREIGVDPDQETMKVYEQYGCSYFRARTLGDVDAYGYERHYPD
jgi:SAM-dependent methyltransferase